MAASASVERFLTRLLIRVVRRRRLLWLVCCAAVAGAVALAVFAGNYGNDLGELFPPDSESGRTFRVMQKSGLTNRVQLEFDTGDAGIEQAKLAPWLDRLAPRLAALPQVRQVDYRFRTAPLADSMRELLPFLPQLLPAPAPGEADPERAAANARRQLMLPAAGAAAMVREDPYGLRGKLMLRLNALNAVSGLAFSPLYPFMVSENGKRASIVLDVTASSADAAASRELVGALEREFRDAPPGVACRIIAPHLHTLGNEEVLKRDITRVGIFSALFLALLFFAIYRGRLESFWIPVIPLGAALLVLGAMALFCDELFFFIIGMGGGILGLAVDHGIHVYAARHGNMGMRRLGRVGLPLLLGAATTVGVFGLLMLTGIAAYAQLGIFAGASLLTSLILSYLLLPTLLPGSGGRKPRFPVPHPPERWAGRTAAVWLVALAAAVWFASELRVKLSLSEFDGSPREVIEAEAAFNRAWRVAPAPAVLMVLAPDPETLARRGEAWSARLAALPGMAGRSFSPTDLWPSEKTRQENLAAWRGVDLDRLERELAAAARKRGLPAGFFAPFFAGVRQGVAEAGTEPPALVRAVRDRMVRANGGGYAAVLFFPDEPELVRAVRAAAVGEPECAVVSPGAFEQMLADDFGGRFLKVLAAAAAGVLALAAFFFRSAALTFLAAVPAVTAMAVLGAVFALCGTALNLIVCFTGIMLAGLTIDYGIFAVYAAKEGRGSTLPAAMGISAATTVFGAAALLFSSHPVLFHTGFALVVGVSVACAAGLLVVPALWTLFKRRGWVAGALLAAVLLAGCRSDVFEAPEYPLLELSSSETAAELAAWNRAALPRFRAQANLSIEYWWVTVPALALVRGDLPAERLAAAGLAPAGAKVFEAAGAGGVLERWELAPYFPGGDREAAAQSVYRDLAAVWLGNAPQPPEGIAPEGRFVEFTLPLSDGDELRYRFAGKPLQLVEKSCRGFWKRRWRVRYYDWKRTGGRWSVGNAVLDDDASGCRIVVRTRTVTPEGGKIE